MKTITTNVDYPILDEVTQAVLDRLRGYSYTGTIIVNEPCSFPDELNGLLFKILEGTSAGEIVILSENGIVRSSHIIGYRNE